MVERGHVLERMTLVRGSDGVELEGLYQRGVLARTNATTADDDDDIDDRGNAMPVVLAAPHPRLGGSMDSAVLAEIVWHLARAGHPTLRFNWRGVGASPGTISADVDEAARDLAAAVDQLAPQGPSAVVGYSFGAAAACIVAATHARVERVVLVAPPVDAFPFHFAPLASSGVSVSILVGTEDSLAPAERVEAAVEKLFPIHRIAGAGHSFTRGLAELGRRVADLL